MRGRGKKRERRLLLFPFHGEFPFLHGPFPLRPLPRVPYGIEKGGREELKGQLICNINQVLAFGVSKNSTLISGTKGKSS